MNNKFFRLQRLKGRLKKLVALPFLLGGLVLSVLTAMNTPFSAQLREHMTTLTIPITTFLSAPVNYFKKLSADISDYTNVYEENKRLRAENETLRAWQRLASSLASDQKELAKLLNYKPVAQGREYVVRILTDYNSPFSQSLIIKGGKNIGVHNGDVLVSNEGLYGFVQEVGKQTSRALKITDYYSRVPVYVGLNRYPAIMVGDNSHTPKIMSLPEESVVHVGDYVMTSGTAGVYPSGIPVGVVQSVEGDVIRVSLAEKEQNPEFVRVIDFGLSGLIEHDCQENWDK